MGASRDYEGRAFAMHASRMPRRAHSTPQLAPSLLRTHGRTLAASLMIPTICSASSTHTFFRQCNGSSRRRAGSRVQAGMGITF